MLTARLRRHCVWPLLCLPCACADPATQAVDPVPTGDAAYGNTPSGFVFPATVDHFRRADIFRQDPKGQSVSVGYTLDDPAGEVTAIVHVYPAKVASGTLALFDTTGSTTAARSMPQITALQHELIQSHPSARVLAQDDAFLVQDGAEQTGRELVISFATVTTIRPETTVIDAYAFCCRARDRAVVYRFQYPQAIATSAQDAIASFLRDLPWAAPQPDEPQHHQAPAMPH